ncbi:squidulin-like [Ruditapes philippinarum]|uniref:squidulin-like n=1 Tax=Ruditapes philippinarum TaxID=129788 RepID=UPI00295B720B|nr:squidulin-like [Ruditapes philippinarum]
MEEAMRVTGETLTKKQVRVLKDTFRLIDCNSDGRISESELKRACSKMGIFLTKDELAEIIAEADIDGSGYIEYNEFERLVGHQLIIANYKNKQLKDAFSKFDKDGDGYITATEIKAAFGESGVYLDDEEVAELVAEADENGDGVISFEEFVSTVCEKDW